jgi:hypothetical protein
MVFSKSFPRTVKGSSYPIWEEISLTNEEEKQIEERARSENIEIMKRCIGDAKEINEKNKVKLAKTLFTKLASHVAYFKEEKCKEKFDRKFNIEQKEDLEVKDLDGWA